MCDWGTCEEHIEDCEGWWLSSCTSQVSWVQFPVTAGLFTFLYFASKHLNLLIHCTVWTKIPCSFYIPYSGKFSQGPNFRNFRNPWPKCENKNREINWRCELLREYLDLWKLRMCVLCAIISLDLMTSLHHYFKLADDVLPSLTGDLSSSVSLVTIKGMVNSAKCMKIKTVKIFSGGETGFSWKFGPVKISRYTVCTAFCQILWKKE